MQVVKLTVEIYKEAIARKAVLQGTSITTGLVMNGRPYIGVGPARSEDIPIPKVRPQENADTRRLKRLRRPNCVVKRRAASFTYEPDRGHV